MRHGDRLTGGTWADTILIPPCQPGRPFFLHTTTAQFVSAFLPGPHNPLDRGFKLRRRPRPDEDLLAALERDFHTAITTEPIHRVPTQRLPDAPVPSAVIRCRIRGDGYVLDILDRDTAEGPMYRLEPDI